MNSNKQYGWGDVPIILSVGLQSYTSTGFYAKLSLLKIQIQPEIFFAQNQSFQGFGENRTEREIRDMFYFLNYGDYPERFGPGGYRNELKNTILYYSRLSQAELSEIGSKGRDWLVENRTFHKLAAEYVSLF